MNFLNRILHNKPSRLVYYLKGIIRYNIGGSFHQKKLQKKLATLEDHPEADYILQRVNYYNKLSFVNEDGLPPELKPLKEHRFKRALKSVYFFDTYEYTRWFSGALKWRYLQGDVTKVPVIASIVKSRPVTGDNQQSVILNLDKIRHFVFLKDAIPFKDKMNKAIFRLAIAGKPHRYDFMRMYFGSPLCDAGTISKNADIPPLWIKPKISLYEHLQYKFILAIEGNDVATNLKWTMSTNSIAVMPRPTYETWFMEGRLIADYHYSEIKSDFSDLEERLQYYIDHPTEAEAIIQHAHQYIEQFKNRKTEDLIALSVLQKCFVRTGQLTEPQYINYDFWEALLA
ncbi:Glycosyl transferase family 90 [Arachidicoccus rhizosphaerae]|uniref:Glycosyl transferase family 90 n=1 Tax=Arachidicoccus rhizosphaerae TaxID=551991 RepID=A0A1H3XAH5_9BACT|nr:glycosyl transferase family 90 [Arachidicoccus rhizosphaerae]SDZ95684.1 Glycosyl transferase family 90 [Arachidicoccus rhizosphaerae]